MTDTSLDDFFAKKDKSKKKSKSKTTSLDPSAQQTEETTKREKKKKDKSATSSTANEEWHDFEEEKEADYTGLRLQNLQIGEKEETREEEENKESGDENDDGEAKDKKDAGQKGPWSASQSQPQATQQAPTAPEKPKEDSAAPKVGKYIPPGARASAASSTPTSSTQSRYKKKAPNITSEEDFPTLGVQSVHADSDTRSFERVQHGGRQLEDPSKSSIQLSLGNKYAALQE
ncbi:hypothetical protein CHS0354_016538 [Potamilus streckersoni]|uniref:Uncharacterized protein n=1 Tax=Potamilus streckersoni TaxID=2493646 RepID=A0AAE0TKM7_9BIVA|nr:hypothetical protein CHS0354_016538 [Potamilus streckersoni]